MLSEKLFIPGPAGRIQAVLEIPETDAPLPAIAVVCHPHPLYGGSLQNKVVHVLARTFVDMGVAVLRFNFRGVGESQGRFDQGQGEQADLQAAVAWLRQRYPDPPLWLAGFSFGAFVAYLAHREVAASRLLLVAPPLRLFEFGEIRPVEVPWLVIQGSDDEIVSADAVQRWVSTQPEPAEFHLLEGASHFFHGRLNDLRKVVQTSWGKKQGE